MVLLSGCQGESDAAADAQAQRPDRSSQTPSVDVAVAEAGQLDEGAEYTGTTGPVREVAVRPRIEGQLLDLRVDAGDAVQQGQILGRIDDNLLMTEVLQAEAELAARQSEVAQAMTQVQSAQTQVEEVRFQLEQARSDADRFQSLLNDGAISAQEAEQARTTANTLLQTLRAAQNQVGTQQQAVSAAQRRVEAQRAVIAQIQERRSFAVLQSPISGVVSARTIEMGNLVQTGDEVLTIGDFSQVKVTVQVSELEFGQIQVGQSVQVRLDAYRNQTFNGTISRIPPVADPTARLIPLEVTMPNPDGRVGSGLLARVRFQQNGSNRVVVPQTALQRPGEARQGRPDGQSGRRPGSNAEAPSRSEGADAPPRLFVIAEGEPPTVEARPVTVGEQADGQVEIIAGLSPGERYVVRSTRPLEDQETVQLSILSN
ncbi:efflux RND transporter periplasmic adaptor subunit [Synechococcales cyanobacterium C]|uniref:Efflux RND transporter periplasmic adaptor subunit n=2 Tax=Petrachloros TaxID=2918834 RepID=A0A8K2AGP9_9CYAN|nr:efflux RND transporter periplasmic adaptor subunit [Petrachloros mirabilis]NCJ04965.1 efflux RND transporter periplasmic adaptor subunit [Petrachloros mirabilis ULC683]